MLRYCFHSLRPDGTAQTELSVTAASLRDALAQAGAHFGRDIRVSRGERDWAGLFADVRGAEGQWMGSVYVVFAEPEARTTQALLPAAG